MWTLRYYNTLASRVHTWIVSGKSEGAQNLIRACQLDAPDAVTVRHSMAEQGLSHLVKHPACGAFRGIDRDYEQCRGLLHLSTQAALWGRRATDSMCIVAFIHCLRSTLPRPPPITSPSPIDNLARRVPTPKPQVLNFFFFDQSLITSLVQ